MKFRNFRALTALILVVSATLPARATALYDYTSSYTITFSVPWNSVETVYTVPPGFPFIGAFVTSESKSGTGFYSADATSQAAQDLERGDRRRWILADPFRGAVMQ